MPNTLPKLKETEIAEVAKMYFEQRGWDLFPEVVLKGFSGRPDFIGKKHSLCSAIECKQTLSYPVIEQVTRWRHDRDECLERGYTSAGIKPIPHLLITFTGGNNKPLALLKKEILRAQKVKIHRYEYPGLFLWALDHMLLEKSPSKVIVQQSHMPCQGHEQTRKLKTYLSSLSVNS